MILTGPDLVVPDPAAPAGSRFVRRPGLAIALDGGTITWIGPRDAADGPLTELEGGLLVPGFVDVQVNGGGGVLLNDAPSAATVRTMAEAHRRFGTTALLPTLITDNLDITRAAIAAVQDALNQRVPGVIGVHLEGPVLGPQRPGVHRAQLFRQLDQEMVDLLSSLRGGITVVTVAPESAPRGAIAALVRRGVKVCLGHTGADFETTRRALAEGATGFTHLFNAMSPLTSREPGAVGAALEDPRAVSGLIMDGAHVHPASARVALKAVGPARIMLVTDAMSAVGSDLARFDLYGTDVVVRGESCWTPDGVLAGSNLSMQGAVRNAVQLMGVDVATASQMASASPAGFLGLSRQMGTLAPGPAADLVWLDGQLTVQGVWQGGVRVH
jgi:N-acetylglucosamine-6-phosphate deacetylase